MSADEQTPETDDTVGPELTQEDLDRAGEKMDGLNERYETGARETVTLPGTDGTVSGTAFADMVDDADTTEKADESGTDQEDSDTRGDQPA